MASQRSTNTMAEFLQRMLGELAVAKTLPDADLQFLVGLETAILQKMREPVDALEGQAAAVPGMEQAQAEALPTQPMGTATPMGGGGTALMGGGGGGGVPNVASQPAMPNPDELRRMLG